MAKKRRGWMRYWVVDWVVERPWALITMLAFTCVLLVFGVTALVVLVTPDQAGGQGGWHAAWLNLMLLLDPGTIGNDNAEHDFWYRVFSLTITIGGILVVSSLIGVLTTALNDKLQQLRRGRTPVVERNHTVVLGWSDDVETILDELLEEGHRRPRAVILDPDPRLPELVEQVRSRLLAKVRADFEHVPASWPERRMEVGRKLRLLRKRLRVVYRIGDPTKIDDLGLVSLETADAVIVPRPVGSNPDKRVLTTLLAVNGRRWPEGVRRPPLVVVVSVATNVEAASFAVARWRNGTESAAHIVDAERVTARVLVQSVRYPGVSVVCRELLTFEGIEVRQPDPSMLERVRKRLAGKRYGEALHLFDQACLIGFQRGEDYLISPFVTADEDGGLLQATDTPIFIAYGSGPADLRMGKHEKKPLWKERNLVPAPLSAPSQTPERILVLGWNGRVGAIITELASNVPPGSTVFIVGTGYSEDAVRSWRGPNLSIDGIADDPSESGVLAMLAVTGALGDVEEYTAIIVLAEEAAAAPDRVEHNNIDAKALVTLLLLQEIKGDVPSRTIICELGDDGNRRLARTIAADDLVVGQRLVSTLAVQYAKNPNAGPLTHIVEKLFHAGDDDICIEPAGNYVTLDSPEVTFADVVEAARRRGQTAIGYRLAADREDYYRNYGVRLNPSKDRKLGLTEGDEIVVIARPPRVGDQDVASSNYVTTTPVVADPV